jgi:hypothetical protein
VFSSIRFSTRTVQYLPLTPHPCNYLSLRQRSCHDRELEPGDAVPDRAARIRSAPGQRVEGSLEGGTILLSRM